MATPVDLPASGRRVLGVGVDAAIGDAAQNALRRAGLRATVITVTDDGDGDEVLRSALRADTYDAVNLGAGLSGQPGLPIYVVSGDDDPLAGRGALVDLVADRYQQAGVRDVTVARYAGARHEVFNETNLDQITADLIAWLDRVTSRWFARSAGPRGSVVVR